MKNKYFVITDNGVVYSSSLKLLNKKNKTQFKEDDFKSFGGERILYLNDSDITYQRDLNYLSQIPISKLYSVDRKPFYVQLISFLFLIIILIQVSNCSSLLVKLVNYFSGR